MCAYVIALLLLPQVVLMRVHASSSELFDRQVEIETFKAVSQAGLGPHLLLLFRNGRVEEFLSEHVSRLGQSVWEGLQPAAAAAAWRRQCHGLARHHLPCRLCVVQHVDAAQDKECVTSALGTDPNTCAGLLLCR
jgi:hypothetical protein